MNHFIFKIMPNFWRTGAPRILKLQWIPLSVLIFGQNSCFFRPTILKIPQPNWQELSLGRRSGNTSNQNKYLFLLKYLKHSQIVLKHFSLFSLIGIEIEIEIVLWRLSRKIEFSGRKPCQFAIDIRHLGFCRTCQKKKNSQKFSKRRKFLN